MFIAGVGLRCYSCINCALGSSIFGSKTADLDEACSHPTDGTPLMSCPYDQEQEYMCGYLEADISFAGGKFNALCFPVND